MKVELTDAATDVLGPPAQGRECGACVACCEVLDINAPTLKKPAGQLCVNCTGAGCAIYEQRPKICATWFCAWRRVPALPEELRPDKIGVMFDLVLSDQPHNILSRLYLRGHPVGPPPYYSNPGLMRAIEVFQRGMLPVWLLLGPEQMTLAHPAGEVGQILVNGGTPSSPTVAAQVAQWRDRYEKL